MGEYLTPSKNRQLLVCFMCALQINPNTMKAHRNEMAVQLVVHIGLPQK